MGSGQSYVSIIQYVGICIMMDAAIGQTAYRLTRQLSGRLIVLDVFSRFPSWLIVFMLDEWERPSEAIGNGWHNLRRPEVYVARLR